MYAGSPGTDWIDPDATIRRMTTMQVAVFKGTAFPGAETRLLHSSPPRSIGEPRMALCIDAVS
jgi:hypothetical protein